MTARLLSVTFPHLLHSTAATKREVHLMSTNISEIMFEMETAGMAKDRVRDIVVELLTAGRWTLLASVGELAGEAALSEAEFELAVANILAITSRPRQQQDNVRAEARA